MRELRLGTVGRITAGMDVGWFVEVLDNRESTGGLLILTFEKLDRTGQGYDTWVESILDVDLYFNEAGWEISWIDS